MAVWKVVLAVTRTQSPGTQVSNWRTPAMSTHSYSGASEARDQLALEVAGGGRLGAGRRACSTPAWTLVSRAISRAACDDAVVHEHATGQLDHADEQHREDDQSERELDEGLAALARVDRRCRRAAAGITGSPSRCACACRSRRSWRRPG